MTTTVRKWTGLEAKVLRAALRMTMREFAGYLGVAPRAVAKWEARGSDIQPLPQAQAILDTALAKASSDVQVRFAAAASDSLASRVTVVDTVPNSGEHRIEADTPTVSSAPILQSSVPTNEKRHVEAATTLLDHALDIDPRFARAQAARGYAQWRRYFSGWESDLSALELALSDVDAVLRLDPNSIGAHTTLIRICWDMGWHERALEIGRAIYEKTPDSLDATLAFARALNNGGMAEAALPLTQAVLQVDPTNPTALKLLIWNYLMVGDYTSVLKAASLYLPAYPRDSNTRWAVALAHCGGGDVREAIHTAQEAIAADPDNVTVWNPARGGTGWFSLVAAATA